MQKGAGQLYKKGVLEKLSRREALRIAAGAAVAKALRLSAWTSETRGSAGGPSAAETRAIAREAYVYAFPMVENYLSMYQLALDPGGKQYKGPVNEVHSEAAAFTPTGAALALPSLVTPNSVAPNLDTIYSWLMVDLRAEPLVVTLPQIEKNRYYSLQLVDLYTSDVDYVGTRKDGNKGGNFLIAGPGWQGEKPAGIRRVISIATELMFAQFRTQLFNEADLDRVKEIQSGYTAQPLSGYLRREPPDAAPEIAYPPISPETFEPRFWKYVNFLLQFCPALPQEAELRTRFERIGVKAGASWPPRDMPQAGSRSVEEAGGQAHRDLEQDALKLTTPVGLFGTPREMAGRYWERALGAMAGLYGNPAVEATSARYTRDGFGESLDASKFDYTLVFEKGKLPPVKAFWSLTMYDGKTRSVVDNTLNRYLINSLMLPTLKKNAEGGITLNLQHDSPGEGLESNWLPAPKGPMEAMLRLYVPEEAALDGEWAAPAMQKVERQGAVENGLQGIEKKKPAHRAPRKHVHHGV